MFHSLYNKKVGCCTFNNIFQTFPDISSWQWVGHNWWNDCGCWGTRALTASTRSLSTGCLKWRLRRPCCTGSVPASMWTMSSLTNNLMSELLGLPFLYNWTWFADVSLYVKSKSVCWLFYQPLLITFAGMVYVFVQIPLLIKCQKGQQLCPVILINLSIWLF